MNSNAYYIDISGTCIRTTTNEAIQAIYSLTKVVDKSKLTNPVF